jgi:hypothetical protein
VPLRLEAPFHALVGKIHRCDSHEIRALIASMFVRTATTIEKKRIGCLGFILNDARDLFLQDCNN